MTSTGASAIPRARAQPTPHGRARPRPAARTREHLHVAPVVRRRRLFVVVVMFVTVASLFTMVGFHVLAAQNAFTLDQTARDRTNEQLRYERLRDEVARLSSPASVIAAARALGMQPATREHFIQAPLAAPRFATPDATSQVLGTATYKQTKQALDQNP